MYYRTRRMYCLRARPCIFQPGNCTGWGSEGVKLLTLTWPLHVTAEVLAATGCCGLSVGGTVGAAEGGKDPRQQPDHADLPAEGDGSGASGPGHRSGQVRKCGSQGGVAQRARQRGFIYSRVLGQALRRLYLLAHLLSHSVAGRRQATRTQ